MRKKQLVGKKPLKAKSPLKKTPTSTKPKKRNGKRIDVKAADLAREIWRLAAGRCEYCGKRKPEVQLQGAHIIGVGTARNISSDLRNGFSLCSYDHRYFHDHPVEFTKWMKTTWAAKYYDRLYSKHLEGSRVDWEDRIDFLKEIKRAIIADEMTIEEAREYEV